MIWNDLFFINFVDRHIALPDIIYAMDLNSITGYITDVFDNSWSVAQVATHLASTSNPHSVTATQVGLGNVSNFAVADQITAEAGTDNASYMTPLRVQQAIDSSLGGASLSGGDGIDKTGSTFSVDLSADSDVNLEIDGSGKLRLTNTLKDSNDNAILLLDTPTLQNNSGDTKIEASNDGGVTVTDPGGYITLGSANMYNSLTDWRIFTNSGTSGYLDLAQGGVSIVSPDGTNYWGAGDTALQAAADGVTRLSVDDNGLALESGVSVSSILDEDNFASDSDTALATQQSIKAYVDGSATSAGDGLTDTAGTFSVNVAEGLEISGGNVTIADTIGGAGLTATDGVAAVGAGTNITVNAADVALATNVDIAGTLDVTSTATFDSTATFAGLATANAGLTVADGQTFTLNTIGLNAVSTSNVGSGLDNATLWTAQASKEYIDARFDARAPKDTADLATTANITLSGEQTIDGVLTSASRVLVKDQTNTSENGIYTTGSGAWTRTSDFDAGAEIMGAHLAIESGGPVNGGTLWLCSNTTAPTVDTDGITFVQTNGASNVVAGDGVAKSGNTLSVNPGDGIEITGDAVAVDLSTDSDVNLEFDGSGDLRLKNVLSNSSASGSLSLDGEFWKSGGGNQVAGFFMDPSNYNPTLKSDDGNTLAYDGWLLHSSNANAYLGITCGNGNGGSIYIDDGSGFTQLLSSDNVDYIRIQDDEAIIGTNNVTRLSANDSGVQLGGANARVTTILDEDDMSSDSPTALSTQQSIKAYVDTEVAAVTLTAGDGLDLTGLDLSVNVGEGIFIEADTIKLADSVGGDGLTATDGVVAVGAGSGITVAADTVSITTDGVTQSHIDFTTLAATQVQTEDGTATEVFVQPSTLIAVNENNVTDAIHSRSATASATYTAAFGRGTASASDAFASGQGTASGANSAALGGSNSTASGDNSLAAGDAVASADFSAAVGSSTASRYGELSAGSGDYGAQRSIGVSMTNTTSNDTETELLLDGNSGTERLVLDNNTTMVFTATIQAVNTSDETERLVYIVEGTCERGANAAATSVSNLTNTRILREDDANWDFSISADTTNGALKITGTGTNGKTLTWSADVAFSQLKLA